jgi:hypothetical protein
MALTLVEEGEAPLLGHAASLEVHRAASVAEEDALVPTALEVDDAVHGLREQWQQVRGHLQGGCDSR